MVDYLDDNLVSATTSKHSIKEDSLRTKGKMGDSTSLEAPMKSLKTLLVANRGEIACRLIKSAK
jgi:hypothetical protein